MRAPVENGAAVQASFSSGANATSALMTGAPRAKQTHLSGSGSAVLLSVERESAGIYSVQALRHVKPSERQSVDPRDKLAREAVRYHALPELPVRDFVGAGTRRHPGASGSYGLDSSGVQTALPLSGESRPMGSWSTDRIVEPVIDARGSLVVPSPERRKRGAGTAPPQAAIGRGATAAVFFGAQEEAGSAPISRPLPAARVTKLALNCGDRTAEALHGFEGLTQAVEAPLTGKRRVGQDVAQASQVSAGVASLLAPAAVQAIASRASLVSSPPPSASARPSYSEAVDADVLPGTRVLHLTPTVSSRSAALPDAYITTNAAAFKGATSGGPRAAEPYRRQLHPVQLTGPNNPYKATSIY
jgi:hypothetical protein